MATRGVNKVILIGNLGADPETRYMPSGSAVTNLRIATGETWRDKESGQQQERTEWHSIAIFGKLAEIASQYLRKGAKVYIEGSLRTRKWQDKATGADRYTTEIVANEMQMLDRPGDGEGRSGGNAGRAGSDRGQPHEYDEHYASTSTFASGHGGDDFDDDIPFARPACLDGLCFPNDGAWFGPTLTDFSK